MKNKLYQSFAMKQYSFLLILLFVITITSSNAQIALRPQPKFWFGMSGAANFNFFTGTTQTLNSTVKAPTAFHKGVGVAPYASILMEYRPNPVLGFMLNLGYDDRGGKFDDVNAPCNCPAKLKTNLGYAVIEPSLRIAPFSNSFYFFVGGGLGYNVRNRFIYEQTQKPGDNRFNTSTGSFSNINKTTLSAHAGLGFDIHLSAVESRTQVNLSPFISYHPYFGRAPRSVESWSISTLRVGLALKFGKGPAIIPVIANVVKPPVEGKKDTVAKVIAVVVPIDANSDADFSVRAPIAIPVKRKFNESFPLRNYIFFKEGSTNIQGKYVTLTKAEATNFQEIQLREADPKTLSGRSARQLTVYYNILNILGDRMRKNPNSNITLIGSSAGKGPELGKASAESVKKYLVDVFGISASRITTEGRNQPIIASEQPGETNDLEMLRDGDRRVDIVSNSKELLAPLEIVALQEDPLDSRVIINTKSKTADPITKWNLQVIDEKGVIQNFGPYTKEQENIAGNTILGNRAEGDYKIIMTANTRDGKTIVKESNIHLTHTVKPIEDALRFSVLFDFDRSVSVSTYENFLKNVLVPQIEDGGTVIIHGHTDIIGSEDYNKNLSAERANDVKKIIEAELLRTGKKNVKIEIFGFGGDPSTAPFENQYPEERFYNRTVIIDVVPK